jgi:hypothetical protein
LDKDEKIIDRLNDISKKIDDLDVGKPDLMTMVNFVSDEQARIAAKNNKQLAIFSCTAMGTIAALFMIYQLSAMVFLIIQGLMAIIPAVLLFIRRRRDELT